MITGACVVSVNAGRIRPVPYGNPHSGATAIDKRAVSGSVAVGTLGVTGDFQDHPQHGGVDKALYAYSRGDAIWWEAELGRPLPPGCFGENLSTEGLDVTGAEIGERWRVGGTVLEVSEPRIPCRVFAGFWDVPDLVKRFTERGDPGAYLRVVAVGQIAAGDSIEVILRPGHGVTIGSAFRARSGCRELVPALLTAPQLPKAWHDWASKVLVAPRR